MQFSTQHKEEREKKNCNRAKCLAWLQPQNVLPIPGKRRIVNSEFRILNSDWLLHCKLTRSYRVNQTNDENHLMEISHFVAV